jgi:hypothetical protein
MTEIIMIKDILFKMATPLVCAFSVASSPLGISAENYYYPNQYENDCCCEPCQDPCCDNNRGWMKTAAVFIGAAAVGAIAGVVTANSNKHHRTRHNHFTTTTTTAEAGPAGPAGPQGPSGPVGPAGTSGTNGDSVAGKTGAGFDAAVVPPGQANAGDQISSLTFTFTTINSIGPGPIVAFVTTPDGRTITGSSFSGDVGSQGFVILPNGPFYYGRYDVGLIIGPMSLSRPGLVSAEITNINGSTTAPALDNAGVIVPAGILTTETFFTAPYPFPEVP